MFPTRIYSHDPYSTALANGRKIGTEFSMKNFRTVTYLRRSLLRFEFLFVGFIHTIVTQQAWQTAGRSEQNLGRNNFRTVSDVNRNWIRFEFLFVWELNRNWIGSAASRRRNHGRIFCELETKIWLRQEINITPYRLTSYDKLASITCVFLGCPSADTYLTLSE